MDIKCNKCQGTKIGLREDKRGLPEFFCMDCKSYIKKAGATELVQFFHEKEAKIPVFKEVQDPCPYCFEKYTRLSGRCLNIQEPITQKYCPICGRKIKDNELV